MDEEKCVRLYDCGRWRIEARDESGGRIRPPKQYIACRVERILRTELAAAFDDPPPVGVRTELLRRDASVPARGGQRPA